ncbi:MAG: type II toxin-antitoxin system HicB family antitoxin [Desulfovibrionaceae bacterium]
MKYPVVFHTDDGEVFGAFVPDFPGCTTMGDSLAECLANVQEAARLWLDVTGKTVPDPSPLEAVAASGDAEDAALVALVDIDLSFLHATRRINITVREDHLEQIDAFVGGRGRGREGGRSAFLVDSALRRIATEGERGPRA